LLMSVEAAGAVVSVLVWASAGLSISAVLTPRASSNFFKLVLPYCHNGNSLMSNVT
jgi:hypothetical protein